MDLKQVGMRSWHWRWFWLFFALGVMLLVPTTQAIDASELAALAGTQNGYVMRVYTDAQGMSMTYYLSIPHPIEPGQRYPLVLLLHGGGERGKSTNTPQQNRSLLLRQSYVAVWSSAAVQKRWPSFIVVPQVMDNDRLVDVPASSGSYWMASQPSNSLRLAREIVDALRQEYRAIDPTRIYITGISMGGYGIWDAVVRWPTYFAAAAPIAGAGDPSHASVLVDLPIWAFHGTADTIVPVAGSRDMIQAIRAAGGHPRYTEYVGAGHGIWMQVYTSPDFLSWLFAQRATAYAHGRMSRF